MTFRLCLDDVYVDGDGGGGDDDEIGEVSGEGMIPQIPTV